MLGQRWELGWVTSSCQWCHQPLPRRPRYCSFTATFFQLSNTCAALQPGRLKSWGAKSIQQDTTSKSSGFQRKNDDLVCYAVLFWGPSIGSCFPNTGRRGELYFPSVFYSLMVATCACWNKKPHLPPLKRVTWADMRWHYLRTHSTIQYVQIQPFRIYFLGTWGRMGLELILRPNLPI